MDGYFTSSEIPEEQVLGLSLVLPASRFCLPIEYSRHDMRSVNVNEVVFTMNSLLVTSKFSIAYKKQLVDQS